MHLSLKSSLGRQILTGIYVKDNRVLDLSTPFSELTFTLDDRSDEGNDATLYTGRYISTDGSTDRGIVADCSAAGAGSYYLTGKIRPNAVTTAELTMDGSTDSGLTGLAAGVWQDFTTATASVTPSSVQVGFDGTTASAADWSDVKLIDSSDGSTVARWQLTESADGNLDGYPALDSSGNGYHGAHTGCAGGTGETGILQTAGQDWNRDSTTYTPTILVPERDALDGFDALGNAIAEPRVNIKQLNLFGDGEYAEIADADSLDVTTEATWEIWVNPFGDFGVDKVFFGKFGATATAQFLLYQNDGQPDDELTLLLGNGSPTSPALWTMPVSDALSQVVFTFDNGTLKGYLNGSEVSLTDILGANPTTLQINAAPVQIGINGSASPAERKIGSPKIYNRALTADEVLQNYNAQKSQYGL